MNKAEIMRLADGYAIAVAQAPHSPRPAQKKLAEQRIEKARSALEAALEQQAEPVAVVDEAIHAAWAAGFVEGEKAALERQAEPDRRDLQAAGTHPAPCARHCEAKAFEIEIRSLKSQLKQQAEPVATMKMLHTYGDTTPPQQQAEPVGEVIDERGEVDYISYVPPVGTKLYTTPPQRKPLTDEQVAALLENCIGSLPVAKQLIRAVEAAHGIKEPKP